MSLSSTLKPFFAIVTPPFVRIGVYYFMPLQNPAQTAQGRGHRLAEPLAREAAPPRRGCCYRRPSVWLPVAARDRGRRMGRLRARGGDRPTNLQHVRPRSEPEGHRREAER